MICHERLPGFVALFLQLRVVADQRPVEQDRRVRIGARIEGVRADEELSARAVAFAGDAEPLAAGPRLDHGHLVLRQRAGLVRADHRGAAQRLDGGEFADQRMVLDHPLHPQGEADGHDRRQAFGNGGDGEAHRGHEQIDDVLLLGLQIVQEAAVQGVGEVRVPEQAIDEHQRADGEARRSEDLPQMLELLLQRRVLGLERLDHLGDETDLGVHARARDQPLAAPVGDQGAHEGGVLAVAQGDFLVQHHAGVLLHRHRFAVSEASSILRLTLSTRRRSAGT